LYISRRFNHPGACWQWFEFIASQPATFLGVPANLEVFESAEWENLFSGGEPRASLAEAYRTAASRPALSQWPDPNLREWLTEALAAVISGEDASATLAAAQAKAERYQACLAAETARTGEAALTSEQRSQCAGQANP
jgi:hypothetical protein